MFSTSFRRARSAPAVTSQRPFDQTTAELAAAQATNEEQVAAERPATNDELLPYLVLAMVMAM